MPENVKKPKINRVQVRSTYDLEDVTEKQGYAPQHLNTRPQISQKAFDWLVETVITRNELWQDEDECQSYVRRALSCALETKTRQTIDVHSIITSALDYTFPLTSIKRLFEINFRKPSEPSWRVGSTNKAQVILQHMEVLMHWLYRLEDDGLDIYGEPLLEKGGNIQEEEEDNIDEDVSEDGGSKDAPITSPSPIKTIDDVNFKMPEEEDEA